MTFILLQFIDLCILLGCDYCESIRGIGPKRAYDLVKQYKNIEEIIKHIDLKVMQKRDVTNCDRQGGFLLKGSYFT